MKSVCCQESRINETITAINLNKRNETKKKNEDILATIIRRYVVYRISSVQTNQIRYIFRMNCMKVIAWSIMTSDDSWLILLLRTHQKTRSMKMKWEKCFVDFIYFLIFEFQEKLPNSCIAACSYYTQSMFEKETKPFLRMNIEYLYL